MKGKRLVKTSDFFLSMPAFLRIVFIVPWPFFCWQMENILVKSKTTTAERERESESESESEWFIEKGRGPMSVVVTNTVKQL